MTKITLTDLVNLQNETTAVSAINANNGILETALDNTLSRDGTSPNTMSASLDMNGHTIINLPAPLSNTEPMRVMDAATLNGGGTITVSPLPTGGATGQVLTKNSNTNFDVLWAINHPVIAGGTTNQVLSKTTNTDYDLTWKNSVTSTGLSMPADFTVTNSPVTTTGTLTAAWASTPTGSGTMVRAVNPTITTPTIASIANGGTLTLPTSTDTLVGRNTTDTLTNKTINASQLTGSLPSAVMPALTGDVTNTVGTVATTIAANAVTNAKAAQMAAFTLKGNSTGSTANATDISITGLTSKGTPVAGDLLIISDSAASGALKSVTASSISGLGAVASIDGKTGTFTTGNGLDSTGGNLIELTSARRTLPTVSVVTTSSHSGGFSANTTGTYTTPANVLWIEVVCVGGGGGGGGGQNAAAGTTGTTSTFGTSLLSCTGGVGGSLSACGTGGSGSGGSFNFAGGSGGPPTPPGTSYNGFGGQGGASYIAGGGNPSQSSGTGGNGPGNSGAGGGGGGASNGTLTGSGGAGGGAGGTTIAILNSPLATYSYTVGGGGAGAAGSSSASSAGGTGGAGAPGIIFVIEHYGT